MPAEPLLLVLDLFDDFFRGPGLTVTRVSLAPPDLSSVLTSIGNKRSEPIWGKLVAEGPGTVSGRHGVQVDRAIFNWLYLLSQLSCPNPAPPTSSLSCIIGSLLSLLTPIQLYNCGLGHRLFFAWCQRLFSYQECVFKWPSPE